MKTHGMSKTRIYRIYRHMINRCYREKTKGFERWGGRGIIVCDEWINNFYCFYEWAMKNGYSEKLSIDRIDNNNGYSPYNCKWSTPLEQVINQGLQKTNKTGYKGVHWEKTHKRWACTIGFNNKYKKIGRFKSIKEAVEARNNYIIANNLPHKIQVYKGV